MAIRIPYEYQEVEYIESTGTFSMGKAINFVDRKFQEGTVGSTNVIEGMVIPVGYPQLVNYTMLYDSGDECEDISGGLEVSETAFSYMGVIQQSYDTFTKNANNIYLKGSYAGGGTPSSKTATLTTKKPVDVSEYTKLVLNIDTVHTSTSSYASRGFIAAIADTSKTTNATLIIPNFAGSPAKSASVKTSGLQIGDLNSVVTGANYIGIELCAVRYETAELSLNLYGVYLCKPDDYLTLASKAGISASSIDGILSASETLLSNKDAVNFMIAQCTGDFMASAIANDTFLSALETSPYKTLIQSNEHWAKFLAMVA